MADKEIPDLTDGGAVQTGDVVHVVRGANSRKATLGGAAGAELADFKAANAVALPQGHIFGCTLSNNSSDATNDIDIAAGSVRDSANAANIICSAMTKRLDANWAAGTGNGFRNSAAAITDTTYHIYAVAKAAGADPDYYAHTSTTVATVLTALQAETGGASYIYARRIGSIIRSGGTILAFSQLGDEFLLSAIVADINASTMGASAVLRTITVPLGIKVRALLNMGIAINATLDGRGLITSPDHADVAAGANSNVGILNNSASDMQSYQVMEVRTNTSAQIRTRFVVGAAGVTLLGNTRGWIDTRGRLA